MKLEHLIQAYKANNIEVELKQMNTKEERAGVLTFADGISASYLLDGEEIIITMKLFFNCLARGSNKLDAQLNHIFKILSVIQNTIMLLCNITQKECNMILESLGLFDNTFQERKSNKTFRT